MKTIWKFPLLITDGPQKVSIPEDHKVRFVGLDPLNTLCLWVEVDDDSPPIDLTFQIHGTGHPIDHTGLYLGTVPQGRFIWHVYQINPTP